MTDPCDLDAVDARRLIGAKELSPVELLESCIDRIEAVNPTVNAVVATCYERARDEAKLAEQAVLDGDDLGLLHGLPIGIKDLTATEDLRTTYGSLLFADNVPARDERIVADIRAAGGIVIGKTNTPEFGAGANTRNKVYGATGNPFGPELTCGGSSGGSAVALATGMMPLASGSDYGGSLRTPASYCGVVGFRPTPGTVPAETRLVGLTPFPVQGPMGRTVADTALLMSAIVDDDRRDPFAGPMNHALLEPLEPADLSSLRVAYSEDLGTAAVDNDIRAIFRARMDALRPAFAQAENLDPDLGPVHDVFEILRRRLLRGCLQRAVGEQPRHARPKHHREHGARTLLQRRRRRLGARGTDQDLSTIPGLHGRHRRLYLPHLLGHAVPHAPALHG